MDGEVETESCRACRFANRTARLDASNRAYCRRFPTAVIVGLNDWCGEYRAAPARACATPEEQS